MKINKVKVGDIIEVPFGNGLAARLQVVHYSNHFKDVIQTKLISVRLFNDSRFKHVNDEKFFWTGAKGFSKRGWKIVGHEPMDLDIDVTERIVADAVWLDDKPAEDADGSDCLRLSDLKLFRSYIRSSFIFVQRNQF